MEIGAMTGATGGWSLLSAAQKEAAAREREDLKRAQATLEKQRQRREDRYTAMEEALAQSRQGDVPMTNLGKCLQIASSIMKGDKVPQSDEKFLSENAPELYRQAILMRRVSDEPEEHESVLEEEDLVESDQATAFKVMRPELEQIVSSLKMEETV